VFRFRPRSGILFLEARINVAIKATVAPVTWPTRPPLGPTCRCKQTVVVRVFAHPRPPRATPPVKDAPFRPRLSDNEWSAMVEWLDGWMVENGRMGQDVIKNAQHFDFYNGRPVARLLRSFHCKGGRWATEGNEALHRDTNI